MSDQFIFNVDIPTSILNKKPNHFYVYRRLNKVTEAEEGQYLCTAENSEGSATTVAVLEVHSMPIIVITPPGQSIKVSPGQHVRLDCRAYGRPQPMVTWSRHHPGQAS